MATERSVAPASRVEPAQTPAAGKTTSETAFCPICLQATTGSFVAHGYRLCTCSRCDYAFIDPAAAAALHSDTLFGDAYFSGGGAGYTNYLDEGKLLYAHGLRYGKLLADAGARRVLDAGAAAGFILRGMLDAGLTGMGVEPNAAMAAHGVRELGLDLQTTTLERFDSSERFDAVALLQVVGHVDDIRTSLERVEELTVPGGWCLFEFSNRGSLTAKLCGTGWHEYSPPTVRRVFSLRALRRLLADYGFTLESTGRPPKFLRADHALSVLRYKAPPLLADTVFATLARLVPAGTKLRYPGDDITWALFRKA